MRIAGMLFLVLFILTAPAYGADIRPVVTEVTDQRSTGQFFNNLKIKIKLLGDDASSIRAIRTSVSKAVDDTGRKLLTDEKKDGQFETVQEGSGHAETTLKLKNPARKATVVAEIAGEIELFMPDRDPAATVLIGGILKKTGKPLDVPSLAKAGVKVTVLTRKEYESLKKAEEKKAKADKGLEQLAVKVFAGLFGAFSQVGDNDVVMKINDPSANLINIDTVDKEGVEINSSGRMTFHNCVILKYDKALPSDARLRIFLKTKKSVVSEPFRLVDVALP
ncbi:MAG: hypothetical protein P8013_00165 [Candidatus Sulfobium sp.]